MTRRRVGMSAGILLVLLALGLPVLAQGGGDPTPTPFFETNNDPELNAQMDHIERATSILRGLEPIQPVTRAFLTRDELLDYLLRMLDEEYPPEMARDDAIFYHAFGLMDLDTDLRQVQLEVLHEQIGGFYDTDIDAMFVISEDDTLSAMNQLLYAHEYTHTLQDQLYDLVALGLDEEVMSADPDRVLALQALVEGDATLMTEGYQAWLMKSNPTVTLELLSTGLSVSTEALMAAPPILQQELLFPYTHGRSFAYALFKEGDGWSLVNEAYSQPPQSTEQILHPERYLAGDAPAAVTVPPLDEALSPGWRLVWDRTLGEFYLRQVLRSLLADDVADAAAEGWGGDRYRVYFNENSGQVVMALRIRWDTPQDADEFARTYWDYAGLREGADLGASRAGGWVCWSGLDVDCMKTWDTTSLIVVAPDAELSDALLALLDQGVTD